MCKKQISSLKNNAKIKGKCNIGLLMGAMLFAIGFSGCGEPAEPLHTDPVIKDHYPGLSEAIVNRNTDALIGHISHENAQVRNLAWRAIAKSSTDQAGMLLEYVIRANEPAAWLALSFHSLNSNQLSRIEQLLSDAPGTFGNACEVFRHQGDAGHIPLLLDRLEFCSSCAVAAGTILSRTEVSAETGINVANAAFDFSDANVRKNLLYGFYRSALNRPEYGSDLYNIISERWADYGIGNDITTDRFMVRILGEPAAERVLDVHNGIRSVDDVQLAVELARNIPIPETSNEVILNFLHHGNPHVIIQTLETLKQRDYSEGELNHYIYKNISSPTRNHELFITSLEYLHGQGFDITGLKHKISFAAQSNPYLTDRTLDLYRLILPVDEYLDSVRENLEYGGIKGLNAVRSLTQFWAEESDTGYDDDILSIVQNSVENGNRSVISGLQTLLTDEDLISGEDFGWIYDAYVRAVEEENYENADQLGDALKTRFPDRFEKHHDDMQPEFRIPNWERLHALGTRPVWRLETNKGTVEIRLDPLSAPFTVSSIDSLTSAGLYDGVTFHRVVRNFVVQGGDFDRRDGFGGPDYRLPTEPSLDSFGRGAAGIASSGTDTEGSQFFFMHLWAPHLDGSYTRFGEVMRGMDVIDRLQIGDRVERASISVR